MKANRLLHEKSPYLLQHAYNPVDWYPWGEEAFAKARQENKPIFLSIGYSTCHWCHVMERESFENPDTAAIMNRLFVNVKLDREERPDVDRIYMTFVQATTGSGGWPMSVFLTPDLKPFFGGTYFPPDSRYGRPGFPQLLNYIGELWETGRAKIAESANDIVEQLRHHTQAQPTAAPVDASAYEALFNHARRTFDSKLGGFGEAPKFPRPVLYHFLLREYARTGNAEARDMVLHTLREMAKGGMYDQLGGGFHRYSVDERWFVPHFEKMLYDQGQLVSSLIEAWQITGDGEFASVARHTIEYVLRDLRHPEGAFYSAEDADSVIDPAHPHEKGEGAFYIWTEAEIREILGPAASAFIRAYGAEPAGNVRHDPQGEFTGRNILYQAGPLDDPTLADSRARLLEARAKRIRPHLDDKILTAWNGLMISGLAKAGAALGEPRYTQAARQAADFLLSRMWSLEEGRLLRRFRGGEAAIPGFLDDYAFFANALVDLYEATFEPSYVEAAAFIAMAMLVRFEDPRGGGFYSSGEGQSDLILRMKEDYDGAEPSGNSIAIEVLLRLSGLTANARFRQAALGALQTFASRLRMQGMAAPRMLAAHMLANAAPKQIILAGEDVSALAAVVHRRFLPARTLIALRNGQDRAAFGRWHPEVAAMTTIGGRAAAYVCENFACQAPVTSAAELEKLL
jgi:uncharacterized protein YyaL (SSP411 family)